jgi:hypothetical protein
MKSDRHFHSRIRIIIKEHNRVIIGRSGSINQLVSSLTGGCTVERCRALPDERLIRTTDGRCCVIRA